MVLANYNYKMIKPTKSNLLQLGYRYYDSIPENDLFRYKFPVVKYRNITTIECEIITELNTGLTKIDVYDKSDGSCYMPFYNVDMRSQYSKDFIELMENRILAEFKKLGIRRVKNGR